MLFLVYLLLWLVFAARFSVEVVVLGIIISAAIYWFARIHMGYKPNASLKILLRKVFLGIRYILVLVWEAFKANISVLKIVFSRKVDVEQQIIYFRSDLKSDVAQTVLANSITLAPGSVTIALKDGLYYVHFLDSGFSEDIENSIFIRELRNIEKYDPPLERKEP